MAALKMRMKASHGKVKTYLSHGARWTIGILTWLGAKLLLFWSLFRRQTVATFEGTSHIPMGLPLPFLVQDQQYMYGPRNRFPIRTRFWAPQEYVTHMLWLGYAIDLVLVWGLLLLIVWLILRKAGKVPGKERPAPEGGRRSCWQRRRYGIKARNWVISSPSTATSSSSPPALPICARSLSSRSNKNGDMRYTC